MVANRPPKIPLYHIHFKKGLKKPNWLIKYIYLSHMFQYSRHPIDLYLLPITLNFERSKQSIKKIKKTTRFFLTSVALKIIYR